MSAAPIERDPIETCIADWHRCIRGQLPGGLDSLLADDVTFFSPVVFTPQKGRDLTKMYLNAAGATFGGSDAKDAENAAASVGELEDGKFRYVKEVLSGHHAVLEFETEMDGKFVNGIDMITCDDEGRIIEFKVMVRPLQAINLLHQKMAAMLAQMQKA